jgi:hypothetical protein
MKKAALIIIIIFMTQLAFAKKARLLSYQKDNFKQDTISDDSRFIYKRPLNNSGDEYQEGSLNLFNVKMNKSFELVRDVILSKSQGWITSDEKIVIFTNIEILVFDKNLKQVEDFFFKENESVLGANYNRQKGSVFFLLSNNTTHQIDLCQFVIATLELKKVKIGLSIHSDGIEAPSKKLFFTQNNTILIENECNNLLLIDLFGANNMRVINYETNNCFGTSGNFNKKGYIFVIYKNKEKTLYEIRQLLLDGKNEKIMNGKNLNSKSVQISIYSNNAESPFIITIDHKYYVYDYKSFKEVKIDDGAKFIYLAKNNVYFLLNNKKVISRKF